MAYIGTMRVAVLLLLAAMAALLITIAVIVTFPAAILHDLRLTGLGLSVFGAFLALLPRVQKGRRDIEAQAQPQQGINPNVVRALVQDTQFAMAGMFFIAIGFLLQFLGSLG